MSPRERGGNPGLHLLGPCALMLEMTIGLKNENLLDDMRNHASFQVHEILLPGRTIRISGTAKLN